MKKIEKYKNIQQVMDAFRVQVNDSLLYCYDNFNGYGTPDALFNYLRSVTTFKSDPRGNEVIQTAQTLFENNIHGRPGYGDCDCLSVLACASLIVNGFDNEMVLAGNKKSYPTHIYNRVKMGNDWYAFDLTESYLGVERTYKFIQYIHVNIFF